MKSSCWSSSFKVFKQYYMLLSVKMESSSYIHIWFYMQRFEMNSTKILSLVENYVNKNCIQNWLRSFWPTWFVVTKLLKSFFCLATQMFGIWGHVMYRSKVFENTYPMIYNTPQRFWNYSRKTKKTKICSFLVTANQVGPNNHNQFRQRFFWT